MPVDQKIKFNNQWLDYSETSTPNPGGENPQPSTWTVDPLLSHDYPPLEDRLASPYLWLTHYFATPIGPISSDNVGPPTPDYTDKRLLAPGGVEFAGTTNEKDHRVYGGHQRDRAIRRAAISGDYAQADRRTDVQRMYDALLDGCVIDILGRPGSSIWTRVIGMYIAVKELGLVGKFYCVPMFDMSGSMGDTVTAQQIVDMIKLLAAEPAQLKINGRTQISWFDPEDKIRQSSLATALQFYQDIKDLAAAQGVPIDMTGSTVESFYSTTNGAVALAPVMDRLGRWGERAPLGSGNTNDTNRGLAQRVYNDYGKPTFGNVSPGDVRPNPFNGNNWHEQVGTEQLRVSADAAIRGNGTPQGGCDWFQVITWNDWSETANICPSRNTGWALLDILKYYIIRSKTGSYPETKRDTTYLAHKTQFSSGMTYTAPFFTNPMELKGANAAVNIVEALVFCKDPVGVTVDITTAAGTTVKSGLIKGLNVYQVPLAAGPANSIKVVMKRNGVIVPDTLLVSPWAVSHTAEVHDPSYRIGSSRRGWNNTYPDIIPDQSLVPIT